MSSFEYGVPASAYLRNKTSGPRQNKSIFGDTVDALAEGFADIPDSAAGIADLVRSPFDSDTSWSQGLKEAATDDYRNWARDTVTDETKAQQEEVARRLQASEDAGDGFWAQAGEAVSAYVDNPRALAYEATRSLGPSIASAYLGAKAGAAIGSLGGPVGSAIGGALGSIGGLGSSLVKRAIGKAAPKVAKPANMLAKTKKGEIAGAIAGAHAGEALLTGGLVAGDIAEYNAEHADTRRALEGVGYSSLSIPSTYLASSLVGKVAGSAEAALVNRTVRESAPYASQTGWGGFGKAILGETVEEAAQAPGETISTNLGTDQPWDKGLGTNVASSALLGGFTGGAMHGGARALHWWSPDDSKVKAKSEPVNLGETQAADAQPFTPPASSEGQAITDPAYADDQEAWERRQAAQAALKQKQEEQKELKAQQEAAKEKRLADKQQREEAKAVEQERINSLRPTFYKNFNFPTDRAVSDKDRSFKSFTDRARDSDGYAPAALALKVAEEKTGIKKFHKPAGITSALNRAYDEDGARSPEDFAQFFERQRDHYIQSNNLRDREAAAGWHMAATYLRNPEADLDAAGAEFMDAHPALAKAKAGKDEPDYKAIYEEYNAKAAEDRLRLNKGEFLNFKQENPNIHNASKVEMAVLIGDQEYTLQGSISNKRFIPDKKQFEALHKAKFADKDPKQLWGRIFANANDVYPTDAEFRKGGFKVPVIKKKEKEDTGKSLSGYKLTSAYREGSMEGHDVGKAQDKAAKAAEPMQYSLPKTLDYSGVLPKTKEDLKAKKTETEPAKQETKPEETEQPEEDFAGMSPVEKKAAEVLSASDNTEKTVKLYSKMSEEEQQEIREFLDDVVDNPVAHGSFIERLPAHAQSALQTIKASREGEQSGKTAGQLAAEAGVEKAHDGEEGSSDVHVRGKGVASDNTDYMETGPRNVIGELLYPLLMQFKKEHPEFKDDSLLTDKNGLDVNNKSFTKTGFVEFLERVGNEPWLSDIFETAISAVDAKDKIFKKLLRSDGAKTQAVIDAIEQIESEAGLVSEALENLKADLKELADQKGVRKEKTLLAQNRAAGIGSKKRESHEEAEKAQQKRAKTAIPLKEGLSIQPKTELTKRLASESIFVVGEHVAGVAIPGKTLNSLKTNVPLTRALKGVVSENFARILQKGLTIWKKAGLPVPDDVYFVEADDAHLKEIGANLSIGAGVYIVENKGAHQSLADGKLIRTGWERTDEKGESYKTPLYGKYIQLSLGSGEPLFQKAMPVHELLHWADAALGGRLSGRVMSQTKDSILRKEISSLIDGEGLEGMSASDRTAIQGLFRAVPRVDKNQRIRFYREICPTVASLSMVSPQFKKVLESGKYPTFNKISKDILNDAKSKLADAQRSDAQSTGNAGVAGTEGKGVPSYQHTSDAGNNTGDQSGVEEAAGAVGEEESGSISGEHAATDGQTGHPTGEQAEGEGGSGADRSGRGTEEVEGVSGDSVSSTEPETYKGLASRLNRLIDRQIDRLPNPAVREFARNAVGALYKHSLGALPTHWIVKMAVDATGIKAFEKWHQKNLDLNRTRNEIMKAAAEVNDKFNRITDPDRKKAISEFLLDSTVKDVWGYMEPERFSSLEEWREYTDVKLTKQQWEDHRELAKRWQAFSKEDKEIVRAILKYNRDLMTRTAKLMAKEARDNKDKLLKLAGTDETLRQEIMDDYDKFLKQTSTWYKNITSSPYVPLRRFGNYVVVVKSKGYQQALKNLKEFEEKLRGQKEVTDKDKENLKLMKDNIALMERNTNHYIVERVDGRGTAAELAKQYETSDAFKEAQVSFFPTAELANENSYSQQSMRRILNGLRARFEESSFSMEEKGIRAKQLAEIRRAMDALWLDSMSEESARQRMRHRRTVKGFSNDLQRAFMESASTSANSLAFMENSDGIFSAEREVANAARELTGGERDVAQTFYNEMVKHQKIMSNPTNRAVQGVMRLNSSMMLMSNPSYHLTNLSQSFLMSAPLIAGRFGRQAFGKILAASIAVGKYLLENKGDLSSFIASLPEDERKGLDHAMRQGIIDIGITQEFGRLDRGESKVGNAVVAVTDKLTSLARAIEVINRVSAWLTAYRMARDSKEKLSVQAAREYADYVVEESHGDYSTYNAPRFMSGLGGWARVLTQFRKFQIFQLGMMVRMLGNAMAGATKEQKAVARAALLYTTAVHIAVVGVRGTPFAAALLGLAGMFDDDDDDWETRTRKAINDKELSDVLLRGIPMLAGVDVSGRAGAATMLDPLPFVDFKLSEGKTNANDYIAALAGPTASQVQKLFTAGQYYIQGDIYKAMETLMPTGLLSNAMKAYRFSTEGYTTKSGDRLTKPEDWGWDDTVTQALGFQPKILSDRSRIQGVIMAKTEQFIAEKTRIYRDYEKAVQARDTVARRIATRELRELRRRMREQGFEGPDVNDMRAASRARRRREREAIDGVQVKKSYRRAVKELVDI